MKVHPFKASSQNMNLKNLPVCLHFMDRPSRLSPQGSLLGAIAVSIFALLPIRSLHATSYAPIGLAEMVETADLIFVAELVPSEDKLNAKIGEVLKGVPPQGFEFSGTIVPYPSGEGKIKRFAGFGEAAVQLDDLTLSSRRIFFLNANQEGRLRTSHPACIVPEETKPRVLEILAMTEDPAPFVKSKRYAGDVNLIYLLGERFQSLSIAVPDVPELEAYLRANLFIVEEMPWQRTRFTISFTFEPSRKQPLQMAKLEAKGAVPDYIRKIAVTEGFGKWARAANEKLPPEFSVTVDTNGPEKIGGLPFAAAAAFLREQLRPEKVEVIGAAYTALAKLMNTKSEQPRPGKVEVIATAYTALAKLKDTETVPIANEMLRHPDREFRRQAALFLAKAKDQRSIEPICVAIDELPPCIRYSSKGYNRVEDELSQALGYAVLKFHDPRFVPALKRAALKGYAGDWMALTLAQLGDESAFEPLLSHMRNPEVDHYPNELITMVDRSNSQKEPWMLETFSSNERAEKKRQSLHWIEWWEAHKAEFRIIRTWEEVRLKKAQ